MMTFQARIAGALRVHPPTFEDVEHDRTATGQAATVVGAAALSGGIADLGTIGLGALPFRLIAGLLGWAIASYVVLFVGTRLLPGKNTEADFGQILRTTGFAQACGLLAAIGVIPLLGGLMRIVVGLWMLVAIIVAVRQALDYEDTLKAVVTCVIAWAIIIGATLIGGYFGLGGAVLTSVGP
jgi:hypothetical protein